MPNWCFTHITFYSKDKSIIEDFNNKLLNWTSQKTLTPDAWNGDVNWLGNILVHSGFDYNDVTNNKINFRYRGSIDDISDEIYDNPNGYWSFYITTETAWCAMIVMWEEIIEKLYAGEIKIAYSAEETGMGEYYKYDSENLFYSDEDYYIESFIEDTDKIRKLFPQLDFNEDPYAYNSNEYYSTKDAIKYMQKVTNSTETDEKKLQELVSEFNDKLKEINDDYYFHAYKYDICKNEDSPIQ